MRRIEALLFDFDGTLVDSADNIVRCFNGALRGRNLPTADEDLIRSMIGRPLREMFAIVVADAGPADVEMLVVAYRSVFQQIDPASFRLLPGASSTVVRLSRRFRLAVVTSRTAAGTRRILEAHALRPHVGTVVGIEDVSRTKPHPEPVHLALERLAADPADALMIGDTVHDVEAGRRAGAMTVGVTTGASSRRELEAAGADRVIDSLVELPSIMTTND